MGKMYFVVEKINTKLDIIIFDIKALNTLFQVSNINCEKNGRNIVLELHHCLYEACGILKKYKNREKYQ